MAAEHVLDAAPSQAVQDPSCTLATEFMILAQEIQTRFVVVVQAVDSYSEPEQVLQVLQARSVDPEQAIV